MHVLKLLRSPKFFYVVVAVLVIQAAFIALVARYPQAFDENYHLGLIELHTKQLLPFFTEQPPGAGIYGAIVREPSYLFQYLMSFPYMALRSITDSFTAQVVVLRFINIGIFVASLFVYRKVLDRLGASVAVRNVVLLFFVLLPVVPLLAGHINYDNLMTLLTGLLFLYAIRYVAWLRSSGPESTRLPVGTVLALISTGMAGSLVKFPFAPIFFAVVVGLAFLTWRHFRRDSAAARTAGWRSRLQFPRLAVLIPLVALTAVLGVLMLERYGINIVRYQDPVPDCQRVLSIETCKQYSPWARDHLYAATLPRPTAQGIVVYPFVWFHRMVYETVFTITSYYDTAYGTVTYKAHPPLTIANWTSWGLVISSLAGIILFWRRIWRNYALRVLGAVIAFYSTVLFLQNYSMYLHSGEAVAIHGRYLIPVFPIILLVCALALRELFDRITIGFKGKSQPRLIQSVKGVLIVFVLVLFLQGGGITNWIMRSDPGWFWQDNAYAQNAGAIARDIVSKFVLPR